MGIKCNRCNSEIIELRRDARGLPVAWCSECGARLKNMSTGEVIEFFEKQIDDLKEAGQFFTDPEAFDKKEEDKPICRFCREQYGVRQGRLGQAYLPVETFYCPVCGRKKQPHDMDY